MRDRASALETAAATPSSTSSVMRISFGTITLPLYRTLAASDRYAAVQQRQFRIQPLRASIQWAQTYNPPMPFDSVLKIADANFPTRWGQFRILGFEGVVANPEPCNESLATPMKRVEAAVALVMGDIHSSPPLVRIHSQCLTGDVFHSLRCDCRQQLELAMGMIAEAGAGILLYEQQEGRGIGLMAKLRAYELQDQGFDTVEANEELGYKADCRVFELPAEMLKMLGVASVRLITNNPEKVAALESVGIEVVERVSAEVASEATFEKYLQVKRDKMGHIDDRQPERVPQRLSS